MSVFLMFDLDDTLYDRSIPLGKATEEILMYGLRKPDGAVWAEKPDRATGTEGAQKEQAAPVWQMELEKHLREWYLIYGRCSQEMFERHEAGEISLEESRILRIQKAVREGMRQFPQIFSRELTREQAARFQESYERHQGQISLPEELSILLQRLAERSVPMGILTNGPTAHQKRKIRALGLERWIPEEWILVSEQAGCAKPDPEIFRMAERRMRLSGYQVWMIGDSLGSDIAGAAAAGWSTVWLNRDGQQASGLPDRTVRTEGELAACIWELANGI